MKYAIVLWSLIFIFPAQAGFIGGIGYIRPDEYRFDNDINSLPFGWSIVPMIAYRGERLNVLGPNVSYLFVKRILSFGLRVNATGDRYKSEGVRKRDTAINGGAFVKLFFLTVNFGRDLSSKYNGHTASASIGWRFKLLENILFNPSVTQRFLSEKYVNYYYGVESSESGRFPVYQTTKAENIIVKLGLTYLLNENNSVATNYSYKFFDRVIYNSPTVSKKSYGTLSLFWNYKF